MINVTERAASGIEELLSTEQAAPGQGVKIVPNGSGGIGLMIDAPADGDEVVRKGEDPLVIVDSAIASQLDGVVLDVADGGEDTGTLRFTLTRP